MTHEEQSAMQLDYRLTQFYSESEDSSVTVYSPIFEELQGLESRYTRPQVVARGGLKQILRVFDIKTGRNVAMAKLLADAPQEMYEPFLREARLTALLEHPYIIAVHDIGVGKDGLPYFTMELKLGDSLGEIIKQLSEGNADYLARYDKRSLLVIFLKVCDAVAYAHSRHVLHLDLKPDNIQVGDFGEVILCDWGLGEIIGSEAEGKFNELLLNPDLLNNMTLSGMIRGTPGFMAPEQVDDLENTERTDIYALGAILYTILTHHVPIDGSKGEILEKTRKGGIQPPRLCFSHLDIPEALDAVAMQALALDPSKRYATADELSGEVRHYISGFATSAERASLGKQLLLLYRRNRRFCLTLGTGLMVVAAVTIVSMGQLKMKEQRATEARVRAEKTLALYESEKKHAEEVTGEYMADLIDVNRSFVNKSEFVEALARIDRAVKRDPMNKEAWSRKGATHFMMQQFKAAAESYTHTGRRGNISSLAQEYDDRKLDSDLLPVADLCDLIARVTKPSMRDRMMMYDSSVRKDRAEHLLVVRAVIGVLNSDWNASQFDYDPSMRFLSLSGPGLRVLSTGQDTARCALRTLSLRTLDLHGSGFFNLKEVVVLPIETLDIRQTEVLDLAPLLGMKDLKKVIVSPSRFPENMLEQIRKELTLAVE